MQKNKDIRKYLFHLSLYELLQPALFINSERLKELSHEIDFKNVDQNLKNLA